MTISPLRYSPTPTIRYASVQPIQPTEKVEKIEPTDVKELYKEDIAELQSRDAEVRAHEAAHMAAGGSAAGAASFEYAIGPDGKMYAVGGEVSIDISTGKDAEETKANMQRVIAAAMAPANPSPQDIKVASTAAMLMSRAALEEEREKIKESSAEYKNAATKKYEEMQALAA